IMYRSSPRRRWRREIGCGGRCDMEIGDATQLLANHITEVNAAAWDFDHLGREEELARQLRKLREPDRFRVIWEVVGPAYPVMAMHIAEQCIVDKGYLEQIFRYGSETRVVLK